VAHLLLNGPRHRAELARALSISRGTTTTIVQQLLQEGILVDGVDGVDGSGPATHDGPATSDRAASGRPDRSSRPAGEGTSGGGPRAARSTAWTATTTAGQQLPPEGQPVAGEGGAGARGPAGRAGGAPREAAGCRTRGGRRGAAGGGRCGGAAVPAPSAPPGR